ncbi:hypothetical protein V8F20_006920 [Naviculisporaceae sp. PSN 640]
MKSTQPFSAVIGATVLLLGWFARPALSYGDRGAAERVLAFAAYVTDEIRDPSERSIAVGCTPRQGTTGRQGLRGGTRCTFGDFCEYLWMETNKGDQKPTNVDWGRYDKDIGDENNTPENLVRRIMSQLTMPNPNYEPDPAKQTSKKTKQPKLRGGNLPGQGFQGKADGVKLGLPPFQPPSDNNLINWYAAMEHCGNRLAEAKVELEVKRATMKPDDFKKFIDPDKEKLFDKWIANAKDSSDLLYDLRLQDKWAFQFAKNPGNDLDGKFGDKAVKIPGKRDAGYMKGKTWFELNIPETIKKMGGVDDQDNLNKFNAIWDPIKNDPKFQDHETALASVKKIKDQLSGCPSFTVDGV